MREERSKVEPGDILRSIYGSLYHKPMNVSFLDGTIVGSARPMSLREVEWLKDHLDVKAILSLTEMPLPQLWLDGLAYKNVVIKNHTVPTITQLADSVGFLLGQSENGRKTAVHCAAGKGRTGTVLAAYLCAKYSLSAKDAIKRVREKRPGSIEKIQENAVLEYEQMLQERRS